MQTEFGFIETPYEIADFMVRLASVQKDASVLDTGFGRGVFLRALINQGYTQIYGIEIHPSHYEISKKIYGHKAQLLKGDFLSEELPPIYKLIIGNPPYIHYNQLPECLKETVAKLIGTREGDIYYAFIWRAIDLLAPQGELIYIVPYHFLYNTHSRHLRSYLEKQGAFQVLIDLGEVRLFRQANPETIIFKWQKQAPPTPIEVLRLTQMRGLSPTQIAQAAWEALQHKRSNALFTYHRNPPFSGTGPWSLQEKKHKTEKGIPLKEIARVGVGLVSGYDKAFIVPPHALSQPCPQCGYAAHCPFLQPFAKAKHCEPFRLTGTTFYLLVPDDIQTEEELLSRCGVLVRQLWTHREVLRTRYLPREKQWFHWQALRNYEFLSVHLSRRRLYVPTMDRRPYSRFAVGQPGVWPAGDVLFIQPYNENDLFPLAAYLNSEAFRKEYVPLGYKRGGRLLFTQRLLESFTLPPNWHLSESLSSPSPNL